MPNELVKTFKWKTTDNEFIQPKDMHSKHLFFTVRMIWNHSMPEETRSLNYKRYYFSKFYSQEYMVEAIRNMVPELMTRNDLDPWMKREIEKWQEHLTKRIENPIRGELHANTD